MTNIEQIKNWISEEQFDEQTRQKVEAKLVSYSQDPHHELDGNQQQDFSAFLENSAKQEEETSQTIQVMKADLNNLPEALQTENDKIETELVASEKKATEQIIQAVNEFKQEVMPDQVEMPATAEQPPVSSPVESIPEPTPEANPFVPQSSVITSV